MGFRRRYPSFPAPRSGVDCPASQFESFHSKPDDDDVALKPSDSVLPVQPLNTAADCLVFTIFFSAVYYLLGCWRDKIRNSTPLHVIGLSEMAALVAFLASSVYLLAFFGVGFVQSLVMGSTLTDDVWDEPEEGDDESHSLGILREEYRRPATCVASELKYRKDVSVTAKVEGADGVSGEDDGDIVDSVIKGSIPSYALESKLGDCVD